MRANVGALGMYLAFFLALLNVSVMYLAVPRVQTAFHTDLSLEQWFVSIYPLMQGGFILAAGTIGDMWGRRRVLLGGTAIFVAASIAAIFAPNATFLIFTRAVEGLGSAALLALPPAMLVALLPDGCDDGPTIKRLAVWGGVAGGLAPVIGGAIVARASWQGVFELSALLGLVVLALLACAPVDQPVRTAKRGFDIVGQAVSVFAFLALSEVFIDGDKDGWLSPIIVGTFAVGLIALWSFIRRERRSARPTIDVRYFGRRSFDISLLVLGTVNFTWYGLFLLCTVFLQSVRHENPLTAGLYLLPCNATFFLANLLSVRFAQRVGLVSAVVLSSLITIAGIFWLLTLHADSNGWQVAAALAIAGIGWGLISTPGTALGMAAVRKTDEGFASATQALVRSLLSVFGIALLGSLPGNSVRPDEFMHGWPLAMVVAGGVTACCAVAVMLFVRRRDGNLPSLERGSA